MQKNLSCFESSFKLDCVKNEDEKSYFIYNPSVNNYSFMNPYFWTYVSEIFAYLKDSKHFAFKEFNEEVIKMRKINEENQLLKSNEIIHFNKNAFIDQYNILVILINSIVNEKVSM